MIYIIIERFPADVKQNFQHNRVIILIYNITANQSFAEMPNSFSITALIAFRFLLSYSSKENV